MGYDAYGILIFRRSRQQIFVTTTSNSVTLNYIPDNYKQSKSIS